MNPVFEAGRWHLDGRGIHTGDPMDLRRPQGWVPVRIESMDRGETLTAHYQVRGEDQVWQLSVSGPEPRWMGDFIRWPEVTS